ncbi:hypothetical protein D3C75_1178980 [compost metagenome]
MFGAAPSGADHRNIAALTFQGLPGVHDDIVHDHSQHGCRQCKQEHLQLDAVPAEFLQHIREGDVHLRILQLLVKGDIQTG